VRGPLAGSRRYLGCVRDDSRSKNVFDGRSPVKQAGRRAETELEGAKKGHRQGRKRRRSGRSGGNGTPRDVLSLDGSSISLPPRGYSRSDGMFINRLIWKIGGWFRVVAGHGSSIAIKHKSIISTRPLRARARARARVGRAFPRCVRHPVVMHTRAAGRTRTYSRGR